MAKRRGRSPAVKDGARPADIPVPAALEGRLRRDLGDQEAEALLEALSHPPLTGLRVRMRDGPVQELTRRLGWSAKPVPWSQEGVVLEASADGLRHAATRHPWQEAGVYYLQDPSAMGVVPVLDPQPGERVLDLAAAPGGKSSYIADRMAAQGQKTQGLLWSHDADAGRVDALVGNLERWGAADTVVSQGPVALLAPLRGSFDRVLLDAPCSGEGMFRKSAAARALWSPERVVGFASLQDQLLDQALDLLRPGGVLVYATCTFASDEDEGAIARLLARRGDVVPEAIDVMGASPALLPAVAPAELAAACVRWWPHKQQGEGHFVARLRRLEAPVAKEAQEEDERSSATRRRGAGAWGEPLAAADLGSYRAFAEAVLGGMPELGERLRRQGEWLWAVPEALPDTGLRLRRSGVQLGRLGKGRFEPHHALSRLLPASGGGAAHLDLGLDDERLAAYLRGETISAGVEDGWLLLRADGKPMGWAKAKGGELNNHYPKGLRRTDQA